MLDQITADQDNEANGSIELVTTGDDSKEFVCCSFRIDRAIWDACKAGTAADLQALIDWLEPEA